MSSVGRQVRGSHPQAQGGARGGEVPWGRGPALRATTGSFLPGDLLTFAPALPTTLPSPAPATGLPAWGRGLARATPSEEGGRAGSSVPTVGEKGTQLNPQARGRPRGSPTNADGRPPHGRVWNGNLVTESCSWPVVQPQARIPLQRSILAFTGQCIAFCISDNVPSKCQGNSSFSRPQGRPTHRRPGALSLLP